MKHFYVFNFRKWKTWSLVAIIAIGLALFLWLQKSMFFPFLFSDEPAAVTRGNSEEPYVALTFNISWGDEKIHDILKTLEKEEVTASFFISGEWAERHPHLVEAIQEGKHEIGSLGYRYKSYLKQDIEAVRRDLFQAKHTLDKLNLGEVRWLRPPSGHFDESIKNLAEQLGLRLIHWTINPDDWKNPGKDKIVQLVNQKISPGDIVLLHASDAAKQTADALPDIIAHIRQKKLIPTTISQLMSQIDTETELVE